MPDYPDIYADGVAISASAFGLTLTFQLTDPSTTAGTEQPAQRIVARIRLSPQLASFVAETLRSAVSQLPQATSQGPSSSKSTVS
jgi:hypothetical protein